VAGGLGLPLVGRPKLVEEQARNRRAGVEGGMVLGGCLVLTWVNCEGSAVAGMGRDVAVVDRVLGVVKCRE
jgi:hypothetical protein